MKWAIPELARQEKHEHSIRAPRVYSITVRFVNNVVIEGVWGERRREGERERETDRELN